MYFQASRQKKRMNKRVPVMIIAPLEIMNLADDIHILVAPAGEKEKQQDKKRGETESRPPTATAAGTP